MNHQAREYFHSHNETPYWLSRLRLNSRARGISLGAPHSKLSGIFRSCQNQPILTSTDQHQNWQTKWLWVKKGYLKNPIGKRKIDQNLWSFGVFFLTHSQMNNEGPLLRPPHLQLPPKLFPKAPDNRRATSGRKSLPTSSRNNGFHPFNWSNAFSSGKPVNLK